MHFIDDDTGYLAWLTSHPNEFVINTYRNPKPDYLRLHQATCKMIQGEPANGAHWTHHYAKVCGHRIELETWARESIGGDVWPCPRCL